MAARAALALDRVVVMPAGVPPHRANEPAVSGFHRFAMASIAIAGLDGLAVSDMELTAPPPSYTADTLARVRAGTGLPPSQIFFIAGADAFAEIATWHRYPEVLDLANFAVVSRPGFPVARLRELLPSLAPRMVQTREPEGLVRGPAIFLVDAHTADVSSTEIRRRLLAGEPVTGMVPPGVETHILQNGLYCHVTTLSAADHLHDQN